jgi:glutamate dehydrogenase/leucine dehydrogenase
VNADDAKKIAEAGCKIVAEGANMPSDPEAIKVYHEKDIEFGPAKVPPAAHRVYSLRFQWSHTAHPPGSCSGDHRQLT